MIEKHKVFWEMTKISKNIEKGENVKKAENFSKEKLIENFNKSKNVDKTWKLLKNFKIIVYFLSRKSKEIINGLEKSKRKIVNKSKYILLHHCKKLKNASKTSSLIRC